MNGKRVPQNARFVERIVRRTGMPENAWGMSDDELLVANHIYKGFNKTPCKVGTYAAEDNIRKVFLLSAPLPTGITHIGTVGTFHRSMMGQPDGEEKFRVELVSSVQDRYVNVMRELLSFLCFCLDNQKYYYNYGEHFSHIFEAACYKKPRISLPHIVFCKPERFGMDLPDLTIGEQRIKFLYVLPISEEELTFLEKNGIQPLEEQLLGNIDPCNLKRKSFAFPDNMTASRNQSPDAPPPRPSEGDPERNMKIERKTFTEDQLKAIFRDYGLEGDVGLAVNPDPTTENRLTAFALEKSGEDAFTVIAKTLIPAALPDEEVEFWGKEGVGEIQLPRLGSAVRYDFQAHEWIFVSWRRWTNAADVHPDPNKAPHLPATFSDILRDYFPKGKRKENYWRTFTAKNGDDFWDIAENGDGDSAFVVEANDGQCVVYACIARRKSIKILSAFFIPKEYGFPLDFWLNFDGNTGAFCVNGKMYGTYDFDALTGEVLS